MEQTRSAGLARVGPPYFGNPGSEADRGAFSPQVRFEFRQAALPELVVDTCSDFPKVQRPREDLLGRDPLHVSPQQGTKRPALVSDRHQGPKGVKADRSNFAYGSARLLMI